MDLIQYFTRHIVAPVWAAWEGSRYLRHYRRLRRTQFDSPDVIAERQLRGVQQIVSHAFRTVPYYRHLFDAHDIDPASIRSLSDLHRVPLLTKKDLRDAGTSLVSQDYPRAALHEKKTSGSTGVPLRVLLDDAGMQFKRACTLRADEWSGWRLGRRVAKVWGNPEYQRLGWRGRLRNSLLDRSTYLDTLRLDESALAEFAEKLRRRPPSLLFGHAHSLYLFAQYVAARRIRDIQPDSIIATAMVLHEWQRRTIEDAFTCRVTNRYGCEEVSLIASECEEHNGLHVNADGLYVEILVNGRPAAKGDSGAVVVTDLVNRAMPLIRYKVGDVAAMSSRRCGCGRGLPLLERLEGREADYVTTEFGDLVSGISLTENFAMQVPGVAQLQIIQEAITRFRFRIVRSPQFDVKSELQLGRLVRERFGPNTRYDLEFVDEIPQEASGKYRFCISHVPVTL
jgi:phenylacetate-CoA ligase